MKKWIYLGSGLAVLAVLTYFAFFWRRAPIEPRNQGSTVPFADEGPPQMVETDKLKSFELINKEGRMKFARNEEGIWYISEPAKDNVQGVFFRALMVELGKMGVAGIIPKSEQEPLAQYGLEPALYTLNLEYDDGRNRTLKVGKENPNGDYVYTRFEGEEQVMMAPDSIRLFLARGLDFYRHRQLLNIEQAEIVELRIKVLDPALRAQLKTPELKRIALQKTKDGKRWVYLEPFQGAVDPEAISLAVGTLETGMGDQIRDIAPRDLSAWGLNPPRAYLEIVYPDRVEKVLVGKEQGDLIWLYQDVREAVIGFSREQVLQILGNDYRIKILMWPEEPRGFNKIEVSFPEAEKPGYSLESADGPRWRVSGREHEQFRKGARNWLTRNFTDRRFVGYLDQRPVPAEFGLKTPRINLKFYSSAGLMHEFQIGKWDKQQSRCYVYDAAKDMLVWYAEDLAEWVPPDGDSFLVKNGEQLGK